MDAATGRWSGHTLWASTDGLAYSLYWDSGRFSPLAGRSTADTSNLSHADSSRTTAAERSIPVAGEAPHWKDRADIRNITDRMLAMGRIVPELGEEVGDLVAKSATLTAGIAELRAAGWTLEYGVEGAGSYTDRERRKITVDGAGIAIRISPTRRPRRSPKRWHWLPTTVRCGMRGTGVGRWRFGSKGRASDGGADHTAP